MGKIFFLVDNLKHLQTYPKSQLLSVGAGILTQAASSISTVGCFQYTIQCCEPNHIFLRRNKMPVNKLV